MSDTDTSSVDNPFAPFEVIPGQNFSIIPRAEVPASILAALDLMRRAAPGIFGDLCVEPVACDLRGPRTFRMWGFVTMTREGLSARTYVIPADPTNANDALPFLDAALTFLSLFAERATTPEAATANLRAAVERVSRHAVFTASKLRDYARDFTPTGRRRAKAREARRLSLEIQSVLRVHAPGLDPETVGRVVAEAFAADLRGLDVDLGAVVADYYAAAKRRGRKASKGAP